MERSHGPKTKRYARLKLAGVAAAGALVGFLALIISGDAVEQPQDWMGCFEEDSAASVLAANADAALTELRAERRELQRRIQAHERALVLLATDWRWEVPEQHAWLELASEQTQAQLNELRESDESAADTEGCLEETEY